MIQEMHSETHRELYPLALAPIILFSNRIPNAI